MEEEINYSTVSFKNGHPPPKAVKEEPTIYAEVNPKEPAPPAPNGGAAAHTHVRVLAVCLGILCVLLVACIGAIVYIRVLMDKQSANIYDLKAENEKLIVEKTILNRKTEEFNWTLGIILKFKTFPVDDYCPGQVESRTLLDCQPCQKGWILFQEKCYLFYNEEPPWKSWGDSRKYCQNTFADLVVIDSLQEQEFLSNDTKFYYDRYHGFWLGLRQTNDDNWFWVDGRNDTLRYWTADALGTPGKYALLIPGRMPTASWDPADYKMQNKFICESDTLIRSN